MNDDSVFLITELWILPETFPQLKTYRKMVNDILEKYKPEYVFHNHAFEWVYGGEGESYPTGIEVVKFETEEIARAAIAALDTPQIKKMEKKVFSRIRCYMSRYAFPENLLRQVYN